MADHELAELHHQLQATRVALHLIVRTWLQHRAGNLEHRDTDMAHAMLTAQDVILRHEVPRIDRFLPLYASPADRIVVRNGQQGLLDHVGNFRRLTPAQADRIRAMPPAPDSQHDPRFDFTADAGGRGERNTGTPRRGRPTSDELMSTTRMCSKCKGKYHQWEFPRFDNHHCETCLPKYLEARERRRAEAALQQTTPSKRQRGLQSLNSSAKKGKVF